MSLDSISNELIDIFNQVTTQSSKNKGTIAIVAISFLFYYVKEYMLKPPKHMRHIPVRFSFIETLKGIFFTGKSFVDNKEQQVMPYVNSSKGEDVYLSITGMGWTVRIASLELAKKLIKLPKMGNSSKGLEHLLVLKFVSGPNLLQVGGEQWKHQRMVANPAFHRNMPINLFGKLSQEVCSIIEKKCDEEVDVTNLMKLFTLESIGKAAFDFSFGALDETPSEWIELYEELNEGFVDLAYYIVPFLDKDFALKFNPKRKELHVKLEKFLAMLDDVIRIKKEKILSGDAQNEDLAEGEKDILTLLIESELQGEGGLTNEELKANLCGFFVAGHETTTSSLTSAVYYLAVNPEIQSKARQAVVSVLGDEPQDVVPTLAEIKNIPYLDHIVKETLRMAPPVLESSPRKLAEDYVFGTTVIPKGSIFQIDAYAIQHNKHVWEEPYKFDPERFDKPAEQISGWFPFGGGRNICIGMNFSSMQQRVMLAMLLKKYTWTLPENSIHQNGIIFEGSLAVTPKNLNINFQRNY